MKNNILIVLALVVSQALSAQIDVGIIASHSIANSSSESVLLGTPEGRRAAEVQFIDHESVTSIGVSLKTAFGPLFAETQLSYRKNSYRLNVQRFLNNDVPVDDIEETSSAIHIPVSAGLKFGKVRIGGGPVFNLKLDKTSNQLEVAGIQDNKRDLKLGAAAGISIDLTNHFTIGARYERSFNTIGNEYRFGGTELELDSKLDFVTFTVGYFL